MEMNDISNHFKEVGLISDDLKIIELDISLSESTSLEDSYIESINNHIEFLVEEKNNIETQISDYFSILPPVPEPQVWIPPEKIVHEKPEVRNLRGFSPQQAFYNKEREGMDLLIDFFQTYFDIDLNDLGINTVRRILESYPDKLIEVSDPDHHGIVHMYRIDKFTFSSINIAYLGAQNPVTGMTSKDVSKIITSPIEDYVYL